MTGFIRLVFPNDLSVRAYEKFCCFGLSGNRPFFPQYLCERLHGAFCARAEGTEDTVLFESTRRDGMMFGFTGSYRRVKVPYDRSKVNAVCRVKLGAMDETHDLLGEILD